MTVTFDITPELQARVEAIAKRSRLSISEIVSDALQHGHSLEWQERFLDKVMSGTIAADAGDFATADDVGRVLNKYRPA